MLLLTWRFVRCLYLHIRLCIGKTFHFKSIVVESTLLVVVCSICCGDDVLYLLMLIVAVQFAISNVPAIERIAVTIISIIRMILSGSNFIGFKYLVNNNVANIMFMYVNCKRWRCNLIFLNETKFASAAGTNGLL